MRMRVGSKDQSRSARLSKPFFMFTVAARTRVLVKLWNECVPT